MMRVRLRPGGSIHTYLHETETETAYVLAGSGTLISGPEGVTTKHQLQDLQRCSRGGVERRRRGGLQRI